MILLGNMKVLLGHLDWGLGNKGPHSDPADKTFTFYLNIIYIKVIYIKGSLWITFEYQKKLFREVY